MIKKFSIVFLGVALLFSVSFVPITKAGEMNISQLVELLITIGAVPADKIDLARAAVTGLSKVSPASTSTSASYLQILLPKAAETWSVDEGDYHTIAWGSRGVSVVKVALFATSTKATKTASSTPDILCELTPAPVISTDGDNTLKIGTPVKCYSGGSQKILADGTYKVKIYGVDNYGKEVKAENGSVKIISPIFKITYPNGGENLSHSSYTIKYSLANATRKNLKASIVGDQNILIPLVLKETKVKATSTKATTTINHSFKIPSDIDSGPYKLKMEVTTTNGNKFEDVSDNFFWISDIL